MKKLTNEEKMIEDIDKIFHLSQIVSKAKSDYDPDPKASFPRFQ